MKKEKLKNHLYEVAINLSKSDEDVILKEGRAIIATLAELARDLDPDNDNEEECAMAGAAIFLLGKMALTIPIVGANQNPNGQNSDGNSSCS